MKNIVEQITKHPAVSRIYSNNVKIAALTDSEALQALCRLRRMRREGKQAIQNAREDVAAVGYTTTPGGGTMPRGERQMQQLRIAQQHAEQLPADLAALVAEALK